MIETPCVIFAGGRSSRMGEDKSLLPFGDFDTLTEFQLAKASKIFKHVYISCKDSSKFGFEADFIYDSKNYSIYAPTIGFVSIFEAIESESFFALSVDTPFITEDIILKLFDEDTKNKGANATVARTKEGMQPMCAIYHRTLLECWLLALLAISVMARDNNSQASRAPPWHIDATEISRITSNSQPRKKMPRQSNALKQSELSADQRKPAQLAGG